MKNELIEYMSQFTELSDEEAQLMIVSYPVRTYKKGSELLKHCPVHFYWGAGPDILATD